MRHRQEPIAVIGIGLRFPGAASPAHFFNMLKEGREAVSDIPPSRWDVEALYDPDPDAPGKMICRRAGLLDDIAGFDWRAFRLPPHESASMDPQHRLLLEVAWEALDDAGLPREAVAGTDTAVFAAVSWNDYLRLQARHWDKLDGYTVAGNPPAFAANRLSYFFDLRGPSHTVNGTCTSSVAALHTACQTLWLGESDLALAGGVNLICSPDSSIMMSKAGVLSPEGRCKTLDADADGFVRGEGAGMLVLKRLADVTPRDRVYAVVRGVALNHNGHNEWIMAAGEAAQTDVIRRACARAGVAPADLDYVELHGTGFPKGDPAEARALGRAAGGNRTRPLRVGAVKTNIGNLEAASGMAGLIKTALCLYHRALTPTLHLHTPNPAIPLDDLGLQPQLRHEPWPKTDRLPLAGVTTCAYSGLNGHVVLEAAPPAAAPEAAQTDGPHLLVLSARDAAALRAMASAFAALLRSPDAPEADALCTTAAVRRSVWEYRLAVVAADAEGLAAALSAYAEGAAHPDLFQGPAVYRAKPVHTTQADFADRADLLRDYAAAFAAGAALPLGRLFPHGYPMLDLPTYPFQREPMWLEHLTPEALYASAPTRPEAEPADALGPALDRLCTALRLALPDTPPAFAKNRVMAFIGEAVTLILGLPADEPVRRTGKLFDLGLTSLSALRLAQTLEKAFEVRVSPTLLFERPTPAALAEWLLAQTARRTPAGTPSPRRAAQLVRDPAFDLFGEVGDLAELSEADAEAALVGALNQLEGGDHV